MDEVARLVRALVDDDETVRLRGIAGLARFPHHPTAVGELMESLKNDLLGELSITAAMALAGMARVDPAVTGVVGRRYGETVGSVALDGGHDPTLRLTYFFAVAGDRAWFREPRSADLRAPTDEHRTRIARYLPRDGTGTSVPRPGPWCGSSRSTPGGCSGRRGPSSPAGAPGSGS